MGKSKPQAMPTATSQSITQTDLPEYAKPYYLDMMGQAQGEMNRPYEPYGGQRIADFTGMQKNAQDAAGNMQRPGQFGAATNMMNQAGLGALNNQYNPGQYEGTGAYQNSGAYSPAGQYQAGNFDATQFNTGNWTDPGVSDKYMSPYMQNVVDVQKQEAIRDAQKGMLVQNLGASRQGTYGGSRQLLAGMERERNLGDELSQIQATGSQAAYDRGQSAFEQFQNRDLQAQGMGEQSKQFGANFGEQSNQFGANFNEMSNQFGANFNEQQNQFGSQFDEQQNQFGHQFDEQSAQFGANFGQQGRNQAIQAAQGLGQLGQAQESSDLARIQAQSTAGAEIQNQNQQYMDQNYGDFLRQRDYKGEQLQQYNSLLRGVPVGMSSTNTAYAPPPSMAGQIGSAGLAGLSMYNMYNNGGRG